MELLQSIVGLQALAELLAAIVGSKALVTVLLSFFRSLVSLI